MSETSYTSPTKRPKLDEEVEILSPSAFRGNAGSAHSDNRNDSYNGASNHGDRLSQDSEIEITASTTVNPNIDYPHVRFHCGVQEFHADAAGIDTTSGKDGNITNCNDTGNEKHCDKCYCYICDCPAATCNYWTVEKIHAITTNDAEESEKNKKLNECGPHCHAYSDKGKWDALKLLVRGKDASTPAADSPMARHANPYSGTHSAAINEILHRLSNPSDSNNATNGTMGIMERIRARKEMRITEVLLENFRNAVSFAGNANTHSNADNSIHVDDKHNINSQNKNTPKTTGDIPTLTPSTPYIEGIQIGFPFAKIMKPQRQILFHLIRALKHSKHVVLESPTGTGKSVAILCGCLGWMRWHWRREREEREKNDANGVVEGMMGGSGGGAGNGRVKIIYCSRTHSQVAQMVAA